MCLFVNIDCSVDGARSDSNNARSLLVVLDFDECCRFIDLNDNLIAVRYRSSIITRAYGERY